MNKIPLSLAAAIIAAFSFNWPVTAQTLTGIQASEKIPGVSEIRLNASTNTPEFIRFNQNQELPLANFNQWAAENLPLDKESRLKTISVMPDRLGMTHYRLEQTVHGIPVDGAMMILHTRDNRIVSMNGRLAGKIIEKPVQIQAADAWQVALDYLGLSGKSLPFIGPGINSPSGELVYGPTGSLQDNRYEKAYRFDIYSLNPLLHKLVYVSSYDGRVIFEQDLIQELDSAGTALTAYSGVQEIVTDFAGPDSFLLRDMTRGGGIMTYNMKEQYNYYLAELFTDDDNYWNNVNATHDEVATDAFWGCEVTYDYFLSRFNLNSLDGNAMPIKVYVHYGQNFANAFWDGTRITLGDGNSTYSPLTSLDIVAHELTHGVTTNTSKLIYAYESGALNESFSDIFGVAVNFAYRPDSARWDLGHDIGKVFRSLINPKSKGHPDTYKGQYWYTGSGDNGGVHRNSGVQNHWFYLLSEGGTGTNDLGNSYSVTGIGIDKAINITYRNLTVYLFPNATYEDARFYAIKAAEDLYGTCSQEFISTINAWYAVGVGEPYNTNLMVDFKPDAYASCNGTITFRNETHGTVIDWLWDFGDGTLSHEANPVHEYTQNGLYTVTLTATTCNGQSTEIKTDLVEIVRPATPVVPPVTLCGSGPVTLNASGNGGILYWYDSPAGGAPIATGDTLSLQNVDQTVSYYVEEVFPQPSILAGLPDTNASFGGYVTANSGGLRFEALKSLILQSVKVYAANSGIVTISLKDENGLLINDTTLYINAGEVILPLGFELAQDMIYQLTVDGNVDLYRNYGNITFPYTVPGVLSILSSVGGSPNDTYYYFYDWKLNEPECRSIRSAIPVQVYQPPVPEIIADGPTQLCEGEAVRLIASAAAEYLWSNGATTRSILVSDPGAYYVILTSGDGCNAQSDPVTVTQQSKPSAGFTANATGLEVSFNNESQGASNWYWNFGDGYSSTDPEPVHQYQSPGTYDIELWAFNGTCDDYFTQTISVDVSTGMAEKPPKVEWKAWPNPTTGSLYVHLENIAQEREINISVVNLLGQTIKSEKFEVVSGSNYFMVDLSDLPASVYIVELQGTVVNESMRVVKD